MPKISVIIPCYNMEKYLRECLDSVVNQTFADIEIICINDGSTDNSLAILEEYATKDRRFIVISQENNGTWNARNKGLNIASAEYVYFMDSDDYMDLALVEKMYNKAKKFDLDICVCRAQALKENNTYENLERAIAKKYIPKEDVFSGKDIPDTLFNLFIGWTWDKFFKRSLIIDNNISFPALQNSEDTFFVYAALIMANKISIIDECLYTYRLNTLHSVSKSRTFEPDAFFKSLDFLKKYLIDKNIYDTYQTGFANYIINFGIWHLETISDKYKEYLFDKMKTYLKENINIKNQYFIDKQIEIIYKTIMKNTNYYSFQIEYSCACNSILENIFSMKNSKDKKYKIITVLWVRFSIRRHIDE